MRVPLGRPRSCGALFDGRPPCARTRARWGPVALAVEASELARLLRLPLVDLLLANGPADPLGGDLDEPSAPPAVDRRRRRLERPQPRHRELVQAPVVRPAH